MVRFIGLMTRWLTLEVLPIPVVHGELREDIRVIRLPYAMDIIKQARRHASHDALTDEEKAATSTSGRRHRRFAERPSCDKTSRHSSMNVPQSTPLMRHDSPIREARKKNAAADTDLGARWTLEHLGIVMEPDLTNPCEAGGVLNPAAARGPDGRLHLLPRLVAAGNYSRIGLARVMTNRHRVPSRVERMGVVLEPEAPYELNVGNGGGVEDARVAYFKPWKLYLMTYTAYGPQGPRVAAASSTDLIHWRRIGLLRFAPHHGVDMDALDNKDAVLFPEPVKAPDGREALALIHRPIFDDVAGFLAQHHQPGMWLSYAPLEELAGSTRLLFGQHHLLASPEHGWEHLRIGAGAPPLRLGDTWLLLYHGVSGHIVEGIDQQQAVRYAAGMLRLDGRDPRKIVYRARYPILAPELQTERAGIVPNVVFPTGLDVPRAGVLDVYYGMADSRIGVARGYLADLPTITWAEVA
jgi:beta-1,2-mannobiose phosphorylase / 1,2-beta-oligomannan phosphorylase